MRVVGGSAGGIPLITPRTELRPTMEVVKNAVFNSLLDFTPGARVLDLFAGCGSLGIEALSRGAASCDFVESDRRACAAIRQNLEKTKLPGGTIHSADALRWLERASGSYQLILADPPYAKRAGETDFTPLLLASPGLRRLIAPGGLFVLEHLPGVTLPLGGTWEVTRQKRYGATEVAFLRVVA